MSKTNHELLVFVLKQLKDEKPFKGGLCHFISNLWHKELVTVEEFERFKSIIFFNIPNRFTIWNLYHIIYYTPDIHWWRVSKKSPRKVYLRYLIRLNKKKPFIIKERAKNTTTTSRTGVE